MQKREETAENEKCKSGGCSDAVQYGIRREPCKSKRDRGCGRCPHPCKAEKSENAPTKEQLEAMKAFVDDAQKTAEKIANEASILSG